MWSGIHICTRVNYICIGQTSASVIFLLHSPPYIEKDEVHQLCQTGWSMSFRGCLLVPHPQCWGYRRVPLTQPLCGSWESELRTAGTLQMEPCPQLQKRNGVKNSKYTGNSVRINTDGPEWWHKPGILALESPTLDSQECKGSPSWKVR